MRFVGVDLGVRSLHVASITDATGTFEGFAALSIEVPPSPYRQVELQYLGDAINNFIDDDCVVIIEEPPYVQNKKTYSELTQVSGAVLGMLNVPATLVNVSTWKKTVVGNGNATKKAIADFLSREYPRYSERCERQDHIDATCIALYGRVTLEGR